MFYGYYNEYSIRAHDVKNVYGQLKVKVEETRTRNTRLRPLRVSKFHRPPRVSDCNFPSPELSWFLMRPSYYELIMATASAWWLHSLALLSIVDTSCQKYLYLAERHHAVTPHIATTTWRAQSEPELMLWLFVFMNKRNFVDLFDWLIMQTIR